MKASETILSSGGEEGGSISGVFAAFSFHPWWWIFWAHWLQIWALIFHCPFRSGLLEGGMQLVQPVYVTQVLVSYLLFPFHLWKDGRNVNKKQGHISWAHWPDLATHPSDHVTNVIQQVFEPYLLLTITLSLIPFLFEMCFFCSVSLQNPCLFPKFLLH